MIKRRRLKPKERAEAIRQLKAGGQIKSVAEALDVGRETIRKIRDAEIHRNEASGGAAQPITVRVSPVEARAFEAAITRAGYKNRSDGLRALVRLATGFLELPGDEGAELDAISRELNKIGVNINQMARLANSGRLPMNGRQMDEFRALHRDLRRLRTFLVQMNTERRRRGVALFLKQAEADNG
ncbi:MAG: plasmid mobilization relaxosome protein MobC [Albidovulum sp.]|uniref:plasmid mobilization relaxosome protein MobC n=1 Tax=Albidovulum sp. TaxID=1872424 RepID=UPI003C9B1BCE